MKLQLKSLLLSPLELIGAGFLALVVVLLANSKQLLSYYGLQSSNQLLKTDAGNSVNHALQGVDSLKATSSIVTFLIWAVVGIVCFAAVESLGSAYKRFNLERQVGSRNYIHPENFDYRVFWRSIAVDTLSGLISLAVLAVAVLLLVDLMLPLSLAYSRVFFFDLSLLNTLYMLLALVITFASLCTVGMALRFVLLRRVIVRPT